MRPRRPLPAELTGPFTAGQARALGVSAKVLRGPSVRRLTESVYVPADTALSHQVLAQAACLAVPHGVISHASAAVLLDLPLAVGAREPARVHLTVAADTWIPDRHLVEAHRAVLPDAHVVAGPAGPMTSAARTFVDLAAWLRVPDLVATGDAILHRRLATAEDLTVLVHWSKGRRGVTAAREALPLLDARAASAMESRARVLFVRSGLPPPEVNAPIFDDVGGWIAEGDLVWRAARLVVDYDGAVHLTEAQRRVDAGRHNLLVAAGWTVLRLTADDVLRRPWQTVALVQAHLRAAAA